jgi:uncharacterized protein (TIGR02246 family)
MNKNEAFAIFEEWNIALKTGNPENVAKLYAPGAILLPTMSNLVRHDHDEIKDYFVHFIANKPRGAILESNIRDLGEIVINSGIYEFTFQDGSKVKARFTYVYTKVNNRWMIIEHHSSQMPEQLNS